MPKYQINYTKISYGYFEGRAKNKKQALEEYTEWDEMENKSNYDVDEESITEVN